MRPFLIKPSGVGVGDRVTAYHGKSIIRTITDHCHTGIPEKLFHYVLLGNTLIELGETYEIQTPVN